MISIVTPTYNSEKYIEECINSILNQKYKDFEHIIVDGGSKDGTIDIIKKYENKYNMRWISEPDNGMYDAIAKGFKMAIGDVFCWLNSDDMYMPWTLVIVSKVIKPGIIDWCVGLPTHYTEYGANYLVSMKIPIYPQNSIRLGWMDGRRIGCIQQESCFWSRKLYEEVGGLNTQLFLAGDYDLWRRFSKITKLYTINSCLSGFRIHMGQKSENRTAYFKEEGDLNILHKFLCKIKFYKIINMIFRIRNRNLLIDIRNNK